MKGKLVILSLVMMVNAVMQVGNGFTQMPAQTIHLTVESGVNEQILKASVQISISVSSNRVTVANTQEVVQSISLGLGTLVVVDKKVFLVTHDHWGDNLQEKSLIQIRSASNRLLGQISGSRFKSLLLYKDGGTMVVEAPQKLARVFIDGLADRVSKGVRGIAMKGSANEPKPGDVVQVARRYGKDGDRIEVINATVVSSDRYKGVSVLKLRNLNGETISPGDSGGGIWFYGKLVGNMLATVQEKVRSTTNPTDVTLNFTDLSLAASLPIDLSKIKTSG
jgi:hypothetical protein